MSGGRDYRVRAADGVEIALHRVDGRPPHRSPPVLLVPGTFTTRDFWLGPRGQGLAPVLAGAGFDPWVMEPRGHGASDRPRRWTMNDWIQLDAPAAAARVLAETGADGFHWMGHSAGGVVGAAYSGTDLPAADALRGLVLVGSPGPIAGSFRRRWLARLACLGARLAPWARFPGAPLGLGPEWEPAPLVADWMRWNLQGAWRDPRGRDYLAALPGLRIPVLGIAGSGDHLLAPPVSVDHLVGRFGGADRTVIVAGRATGYRCDYDHAELLIGRNAREEIWPRIVSWLHDRTGPPERSTTPPGEA